MPKVSDLFELEYGHSLELNRLTQSSASDAVNFVGRAARNNGVTARVAPIANLAPAAAGTISVALGGQGGAGVAFLQPLPYYCGRDVMILTPKASMSDREKLWWVSCISFNRFRFGFGRQANRTLKDISLPELKDRPEWVESLRFDEIFSAALQDIVSLSAPPPASALADMGTKRVCVSDVFDVQMGTNMELVRMVRQDDGINFVSRTARNNGVASRVAAVNGVKPTPGWVLSVAGGGSVLETFVQFEPFYSGRDLFVLKPKKKMLAEELMFYASCIKCNQFRYSYGRQANRTLKELQIPSREAIPRWVYGSLERVSGRLQRLVTS